MDAHGLKSFSFDAFRAGPHDAHRISFGSTLKATLPLYNLCFLVEHDTVNMILTCLYEAHAELYL